VRTEELRKRKRKRQSEDDDEEPKARKRKNSEKRVGTDLISVCLYMQILPNTEPSEDEN